MNILVYEYILGEEIDENTPLLLINEAKLIIHSIIKDLSKNYPSSKITLLVDKKNKNFFENTSILERNHESDLIDDFINHKNDYDKILVLAPEENYILYEIVRKMEENNISHLNSASNVIKITTNKSDTNKIFKKILSNTLPMHQNYIEIESDELIISKKIDGIGAEDLFIFKNREDLERNINKLTKKHYFQKFINGVTIGVNIFAFKGFYRILSINEQIYQRKSEHEIYLKEMFIGKYNKLILDFDNIINSILLNFEGLSGFFGVDFIMTDNNEIFFLEINPRLTTSYSFLHESLGFNPMQLYNNINFDFNINNNKLFSKNLIT